MRAAPVQRHLTSAPPGAPPCPRAWSARSPVPAPGRRSPPRAGAHPGCRPHGRGRRPRRRRVVELGCGTVYVSAWLARARRASDRRQRDPGATRHSACLPAGVRYRLSARRGQRRERPAARGELRPARVRVQRQHLVRSASVDSRGAPVIPTIAQQRMSTSAHARARPKQCSVSWPRFPLRKSLMGRIQHTNTIKFCRVMTSSSDAFDVFRGLPGPQLAQSKRVSQPKPSTFRSLDAGRVQDFLRRPDSGSSSTKACQLIRSTGGS